MMRLGSTSGAAGSAYCPAWTWSALAVLLAGLPLCFSDGFALGLMSQICAMSVLVLSYNLLLGHTGMLSFGHAVYSGLGGFAAMHGLKLIEGGSTLYVLALPLIAGVAGALAAVVLGFFTTRRGGTPFAMISLGIGELVYVGAAMLPSVFGGEAGIVGNRAAGEPFFGLSFGPDIEIYYLTACWALLCLFAMYFLTRTPLLTLANAVRDNPQRVNFIGQSPHTVRFLMQVIAAFFAAIAGGLLALNIEIATTETLGILRSGNILLAAVIGGTGFFFGPVLGAITITLFTLALSRYTNAWQLYLGLSFAAIVMFAPGGMAGWLHAGLRELRAGRLAVHLLQGAGSMSGWVILIAGLGLLIESAYALSYGQAGETFVSLPGMQLDAATPQPWIWAGVLIVVGVPVLVMGWRRQRSSQGARTWGPRPL